MSDASPHFFASSLQLGTGAGPGGGSALHCWVPVQSVELCFFLARKQSTRAFMQSAGNSLSTWQHAVRGKPLDTQSALANVHQVLRFPVLVAQVLLELQNPVLVDLEVILSMARLKLAQRNGRGHHVRGQAPAVCRPFGPGGFGALFLASDLN